MKRMFLPLLLAGFLATPNAGVADLGPKPHFEIFFDDSVESDAKSELFTCEDASCSDAAPFKEFGPQRFRCAVPQDKKNLACYAMAYGFSPYLKVRLTVKGAQYDSAPFEPGKDFDAALKDGKLLLSPRGFLKNLFSR